MKLSTLTVLSDEEVRQIHAASLHILAHSGVKVMNAAMLAFLRDAGLDVDFERQLVRFSAACVEDAVSRVPGRIDIFARDGQPAFTLGDGSAKIAAGHNAVFWLDAESGETRPSRVADVERFAHLCEQLPAIDMIGIPVMPQDVPHPRATLLHGVRAVITHSRKPVYFSTDRCDVNHACIELLRAAFPGDMTARPYGISQLSPTSPLYWEGEVIEALRDTVAHGVPLAILPEPNAGVSAPYTLAGLLTVNNVECLSGIVIAQLLRPGAPVLYANSWTTTDMRSGAALVGSTETSICRIAGAQLARFYHVPSHTTAPNSDNHAHDEQNAWEKTFSLFAAVAAGNDLIVNCGMFATGMTCSHEQLLMDEEIAAMSRRLAAGVTVTEETIARELIETVGPQGESYLTQEHTLDHLHHDEFLLPRLARRGPRAVWEQDGAPDSYAIAHREVARLAANPVAGVSADIEAALAQVIEGYLSHN